MEDSRPVWRKIFDSAERAVGPELEAAVRSEPFAAAVTLLTHLRSGIARHSERTTRRFLHLWNLPAGSDVKRISEQVASLERRVRELSKRVEDLGVRTDDERSRPQRPRRSHSA